MKLNKIYILLLFVYLLFGLMGCKSENELKLQIIKTYNKETGELLRIDTIEIKNLEDGFDSIKLKTYGKYYKLKTKFYKDSIKIIYKDSAKTIFRKNNYFDGFHLDGTNTPFFNRNQRIKNIKNYLVDNINYEVSFYEINSHSDSYRYVYYTPQYGFILYFSGGEYSRISQLKNYSKGENERLINLIDKILSDRSFNYLTARWLPPPHGKEKNKYNIPLTNQKWCIDEDIRHFEVKVNDSIKLIINRSNDYLEFHKDIWLDQWYNFLLETNIIKCNESSKGNHIRWKGSLNTEVEPLEGIEIFTSNADKYLYDNFNYKTETFDSITVNPIIIQEFEKENLFKVELILNKKDAK